MPKDTVVSATHFMDALKDAGLSRDAEIVLQRSFAVGDKSNLKVWVPPLRRGEIENRLSKSIRGDIGAGLGALGSAAGSGGDVRKLVTGIDQAANAPRGTVHRINEAFATLGAYNGISSISEIHQRTNAMLKMAAQMPVVAGVINTRVAQAQACPWDIEMVEERASMTRAVRKRRDEIKAVVRDGGYALHPDGSERVHPFTGEPGVWDGYGMQKALGFRGMLAALIRNSLEMDWAPLRMEPGHDVEKYPIAFFTPMDGSTVQAVDRTMYQPVLDRDTLGRIEFVELPSSRAQALSNSVVREFTWDRLGVMVRNQRVDALGYGLGHSEVETIVEILAMMVSLQRYQGDYFSNNFVPLGVMSIVGETMGEESFQDLQMQLSRVGGMDAFFRILYMHFSDPGSKVEFTPLKAATGVASEMSIVMQLFASIRDIVYGVMLISAEEVSQTTQNMNGPHLSAPGPQQAIEASKSKGFLPLMTAVEDFINKRIVSRIDPEFKFTFPNLDGSDEAEDLDVATKYFAMGYTPNQLRDMSDKPRVQEPVENDIYRKCKKKYQEEDFETHEEWLDKVNESYEKECKKQELPKIWSAWPDAPVGCAMAFQIYQTEQQANDQAKQAALQAAQGVGPDGQPLPPGVPQPGAPQVGPDGQPIDPNANPNAANGQEPDPNDQAANAQDPNADPNQPDPQNPFGH